MMYLSTVYQLKCHINNYHDVSEYSILIEMSHQCNYHVSEYRIPIEMSHQCNYFFMYLSTEYQLKCLRAI